ncbi:phage Gp37/Gp68 family protein [Paenibacillus sp. HN-1]|uniref:DUF5131 family protein n=1 Tax=Paenibacillus TaxID=44249 RepID=UPI001CAA2760|nr:MULTISPECIES: phage Gp37/Gp68 family protein [Paenibacillus]MBY9081021.1 phage Gp37/Gp68 family protein [Paenibacillus sp. CGMCC 1.18879]MBY9087058.1 phage Gp37/Gp68 family protein [Paenibacillus sinensis]
MGDKTKIEWTDATWNPIVGCSKVSEGCRNCYAFDLHGQRHTAKQAGKQLPEQYAKPFSEIQLFPDRLDQPLRWRRPRRIFVNSMSDLFHPDVPDEYIDEVFEVMAMCQNHTFQVLTKRPARMLEWFNTVRSRRPIQGQGVCTGGSPFCMGAYCKTHDASVGYCGSPWPLPNVWLGVTVENQQAADERIPLLLQTPAAVRFLSCEPLLGSVDLSKWLMTPGWVPSYYDPDNRNGQPNAEPTNDYINWCIVGGESGSKARPMHPDWARSLRDQCQAAGVPFLFKQWGEWKETHSLRCNEPGIKGKPWVTFDPDTSVCRIGKQAAGRELDGRTWDEYPEGGQS